MRKEKINGHTFEFYDDIEDLPISQFHKYSKYLLVDSGIGSDIGSIDGHINRILSCIGVDNKKAVKELLNLRRNLYMVANEEDFKTKCFLCLTCKVDGKKWEDFTDSGIEELYLMVQDEKMLRMLSSFVEVKEKIDEELKIYFPQVFQDSVSKNMEDILRKRALLQLSVIIDDTPHEEEISKLNERLVGYFKVQNFEDGEDNAEILFDKQFEAMCLAMSKEFGGIVKGYSVMEFYSAYESMTKQNEELKKIKARRK